jgi:uncharacterized protein
MKNRFLGLVLTLSTVLLAACGTSPTTKLYRLSADANESHRVATDKRRIEVVAVRIPTLWDRPQIVLSKSANEVALSEFHRWADPLRSEMPRIVVRNLSRLLDNPTVWLREDLSGTHPDLRVAVVIHRLDAVAGERLRLEASWVIRATEGNASRAGSTNIDEPLADASHDAVASAASRVLLALSRDVAKDLQVPLAR